MEPVSVMRSWCLIPQGAVCAFQLQGYVEVLNALPAIYLIYPVRIVPGLLLVRVLCFCCVLCEGHALGRAGEGPWPSFEPMRCVDLLDAVCIDELRVTGRATRGHGRRVPPCPWPCAWRGRPSLSSLRSSTVGACLHRHCMYVRM